MNQPVAHTDQQQRAQHNVHRTQHYTQHTTTPHNFHLSSLLVSSMCSRMISLQGVPFHPWTTYFPPNTYKQPIYNVQSHDLIAGHHTRRPRALPRSYSVVFTVGARGLVD